MERSRTPSRNQRSHEPGLDWHPIMAAVEGPTAVWRMVDAAGREYGRIELRRVMNGSDVRYRASFRGEVLGWAVTLRTAAERIHSAHLATHSPKIGSGAPDPRDLAARAQGRR